MTQPSGWYDDPQDPSKLRYWDGVIWTQHVTPKQAPSLEQSTIGSPPQPTGPGAQGQPGTQAGPPAYPSAPGPMPGWQQPYAMGQATTPDGVPLSGWWKRVLARILDGIITAIIALPLTLWFFVPASRELGDWFRAVVDAAQAGAPAPPLQVHAFLLLMGGQLIALLVAVVYEYLFLTRTGATLGKRAVGISVRLRAAPGPLPSAAAWRRIGVLDGLQLLTIIPIVSNVAGIALLLDYLWPLWDGNKQAWHDKFAATNVVVGPQPKRP